MTGLVVGARRLLRRGDDLVLRVDALQEAVTSGRGRLDDAALNDAQETVDRAQERLRLSGAHTVVALAGATGSGKSSLFNKLTGLDLAAVGVRRPTTSWALACAWGPDDAADLLGWLGIPARHQVQRTSLLDTSTDDSRLAGLVLLDLPDHDSTEVSHHLEVDRLVKHADLLVWVLDPQKYADAAIHDRYLRPLATHSDVMLVVLNQADQLPAGTRGSTLADVRRLLSADGLHDVPVLATSARTGAGVDELRAAIAKRVRAKAAATARLALDVSATAQRLTELNGTAATSAPGKDRVAALDDALAEAAGVPVVVQAVRRSTATRRRRATGWPLIRWVGRLRKDPLADLHLGTADSTALVRSSLPPASKVQQARVDLAVRDLAEDASRGLDPSWARSVRTASSANSADLHDALDQAIVSTGIAVDRTPLWVRAFNAVQWLLVVVAVVGAGWLAALAGLAFLQVGAYQPPRVSGLALPTLLLVVAVVLGLAVAAAGRAVADRSAARAARRADVRLRGAIAAVADERVVQPLVAELTAYEHTRDALRVAGGR